MAPTKKVAEDFSFSKIHKTLGVANAPWLMQQDRLVYSSDNVEDDDDDDEFWNEFLSDETNETDAYDMYDNGELDLHRLEAMNDEELQRELESLQGWEERDAAIKIQARFRGQRTRDEFQQYADVDDETLDLELERLQLELSELKRQTGEDDSEDDSEEKALEKYEEHLSQSPWREAYSEDGQVYYYHEETLETSWELPEELWNDDDAAGAAGAVAFAVDEEDDDDLLASLFDSEDEDDNEAEFDADFGFQSGGNGYGGGGGETKSDQVYDQELQEEFSFQNTKPRTGYRPRLVDVGRQDSGPELITSSNRGTAYYNGGERNRPTMPVIDETSRVEELEQDNFSFSGAGSGKKTSTAERDDDSDDSLSGLFSSDDDDNDSISDLFDSDSEEEGNVKKPGVASSIVDDTDTNDDFTFNIVGGNKLAPTTRVVEDFSFSKIHTTNGIKNAPWLQKDRLVYSNDDGEQLFEAPREQERYYTSYDDEQGVEVKTEDRLNNTEGDNFSFRVAASPEPSNVDEYDDPFLDALFDENDIEEEAEREAREAQAAILFGTKNNDKDVNTDLTNTNGEPDRDSDESLLADLFFSSDSDEEKHQEIDANDAAAEAAVEELLGGDDLDSLFADEQDEDVNELNAENEQYEGYQVDPSLPAGWFSALSADGEEYYYTDSGETQWERPETEASGGGDEAELNDADLDDLFDDEEELNDADLDDLFDDEEELNDADLDDLFDSSSDDEGGDFSFSRPR